MIGAAEVYADILYIEREYAFLDAVGPRRRRRRRRRR